MPTDHAAAGAILDRVAPRLAGTVGDVRGIVRGLRPAAVDDLGLAGAVRELSGRFATPGLAISVDADADGGLPAAVEVAAYRIVAEALANAVRHAGAGSVNVVVEQRPDRLRLCVEDDGRGVPADRDGGGLGVASMRERARELGGAFTMTPGRSGRGTRVEVLLPLGAH
jgi:two-component system NarL family sensor kinase